MMTSSVEDNWPWEFGSHPRRSASGRGAVVTALEKKRGYLNCLRNVTLLPFIKYTKKGVSDYILCIARV